MNLCVCIQMICSFQKLVTYQRENGEYRIDYGLFHATIEVDCVTQSAKQLDEMRVSTFLPPKSGVTYCRRRV